MILELGRPDATGVRVAHVPYLTAVSVLTDAVANRPRGISERLRKAVRSVTFADGAEVLRPLAGCGQALLPDCLGPASPAGEAALDHELERIRALSADDLLDGVRRLPGAAQAGWLPVLRRPGPWLDRFAALIGQVWQVCGPLWQEAGSLRDREVQRVGAAVVRGDLDLLIASLHPEIRVTGTAVRLPGLREPRGLDGRVIVLAPMLAGSRALVHNLDLDDAVCVGYALPGVGTLTLGGRERLPSPGDPLAELLGPVRSTVLHAVEVPRAMTELARQTGCLPSTITYHCDRLVAAGLLRRERSGRTVYVTRSDRGTDLVRVLSAS